VGTNLAAAVVVIALSGVAAAVLLLVRARAHRGIATAAQRATYDVLHRAGLAADSLRPGLTPASATKAVRHLHALVGGVGLALADAEGVLALTGLGDHHRGALQAAARRCASTGRTAILHGADLACGVVDCPVRGAVVVALSNPDGWIGALVAISEDPPAPGLVEAALETARFVSAQAALAELATSRAKLARAEVRALRAQISPHFVYNALTAIASFVRTDPERARDLILEFAEFTRYAFRAHGDFTTLADELGSIDRYLTIERARFGERLQVRLRIAPEVLPVGLPFLCVQPLVENAIRHGLSRKPGLGTVSITAADAGAECLITVEDDGVGMDPGVFAQVGAEESTDAGQHVGLSNVDERLRTVFGDEFGLVVETAPGAGTKVSMRVPKFHPQVRVRPATPGWARAA
jgi:two-component system, LytTR family, sensor kinase